MTWEYVIPNVETGAPSRASELPMDNDAFAAFYKRSARSLWAYLARVSGDPALADDFMQESYVRFLCASRPDEGEVASRRYLFGIATNLLRDHWRKPASTSIEELPEEMLAEKDRAMQLDSTPAWAGRWHACGRGTGSCCGWRMRRIIRIGRSRRLQDWVKRASGCCCSGRDARWQNCCGNVPQRKRGGA